MDQTWHGDRLWRLTAEHSPLGMTLVAPDGTVLTANRALCTMLRCTEDDLRGTPYEHLTHLDDRQRHVDLFDKTVHGGGESYHLTKRCLRRDGTVLWGELSASVLRSDDGEPRLVIGQLVDVTRQREHEEQLAEALETITRQRQTAQIILDSVDTGLLLLDRDGGYEFSNRRHASLLALAFPDGHHGHAGQVGEVYAADGTTLLSADQTPSARASRGEQFDDCRIWIGADPLRRRAISVSSRAVYDARGGFAGAGMAYHDVTDLMRAIRTRDDFLASVSHELRTPLASVIGYLEMLSESPRLEPDVLHHLEVIRRNAGRLGDLVSDLLLSAQHRTGPVVLDRCPTDLSALVADALEAALPAARAGGISLEGDVLRDVRGELDPSRLGQVIDNLLSNAVKYSDAGDRVTVSLRRLEGQAVLRISDTGIGMSREDQSQLFVPFFRADAARERHAPGVGLGLGIAKALVDAHGGRIEVASSLGRGTTFTAWVPLRG